MGKWMHLEEILFVERFLGSEPVIKGWQFKVAQILELNKIEVRTHIVEMTDHRFLLKHLYKIGAYTSHTLSSE